MSNGQDIKVNFPPELHGGVYSNNMVVSHTKEEFVLDFLMVAPPAGAVTAKGIGFSRLNTALTVLGEPMSLDLSLKPL